MAEQYLVKCNIGCFLDGVYLFDEAGTLDRVVTSIWNAGYKFSCARYCLDRIWQADVFQYCAAESYTTDCLEQSRGATPIATERYASGNSGRASKDECDMLMFPFAYSPTARARHSLNC